MPIFGNSQKATAKAENEAWLAKRRFFIQIAKENQTRLFPSLLESDARVRTSLSSAHLHNQIEPLHPLAPTDEAQKTTVHVVPLDSFDCAEQLTLEGKQNIAVLNMASSITPGGGYLTGASAQEEALCRRSTLYLTIDRKEFYPIPGHAGIFSPDVLVLRRSDDDQCAFIPSQGWWTSVISVAAIRDPQLTRSGEDYASEQDREDMRERMRTMLRIASKEDRQNLVLGAFGCGAFRNPPRAVAGMFKGVLVETEFLGRFEGIWFAVIERGGSENYDTFKEVLDGMEI